MKMRKEKRRMEWEGVGETESIGKKEDEYRLTWSRSMSLARPGKITSRKIKGVRRSTFTVSSAKLHLHLCQRHDHENHGSV